MPQSPSSADAVVIVGGGFGGLTAALTLTRLQPRSPIVLIEPRERFVFQPLLYELLSDELQTWEVAPDYRSLLSSKGITWIRDHAVSVDTTAKIVRTRSGDRLSWSRLLLASGAGPNDFGIEGVRDHAQTFQTLEDVNRLRDRVRDLRRQRRTDAALVIVGAGPTGVELACKLADLLEGSARLHLIEMGPTILPGSTSFNREKAVAALERKQVAVHLTTQVTSLSGDRVHLSDGRNLSHDGVIWTAGSRPTVPTITPPAAQTGMRLSIDPQLRLEQLQDVFAVGDATRCQDQPWPSTAQVAMQQGESVARSIQALRSGDAPQPFQFQDRGEMLSLGVGNATLTGMGMTLAGPLAFQLRRATYLTRLPGLSLGLRSAGAWLLGR